MKRTHPQSPTIKNEVGQEPLAKRVKQEGAGAGAVAATALMPALVAVKKEIGSDSVQHAVHFGNTQTLEAQLAELRQLVQTQGKQLQSQQLQFQSNQMASQKRKINELEQTSIRIKQLPEGEYRGPLVNELETGFGSMRYKKDDPYGRMSYVGDFKDGEAHGQGTFDRELHHL